MKVMCFHKYRSDVATKKFKDCSIHIPYSFIECILGAGSVSGLILGTGDKKVIDGSCPHRVPSLVGKTDKEIVG